MYVLSVTTDWLDRAGTAVEALGVAVIIAGIVIASTLFVRELRQAHAWMEIYRGFRRDLGQSILLGLELLVAGDIIRTVSVNPTLEDVAVLGGIVVIRTFLSFSLEVEISGRWPWARSETAANDQADHA